MATLAATICGVVWLVFSVVANDVIATVAASIAALFFVLLWGLVPIAGGHRRIVDE